MKKISEKKMAKAIEDYINNADDELTISSHYKDNNKLKINRSHPRNINKFSKYFELVSWAVFSSMMGLFTYHFLFLADFETYQTYLLGWSIVGIGAIILFLIGKQVWDMFNASE